MEYRAELVILILLCVSAGTVSVDVSTTPASDSTFFNTNDAFSSSSSSPSSSSSSCGTINEVSAALWLADAELRLTVGNVADIATGGRDLNVTQLIQDLEDEGQLPYDILLSYQLLTAPGFTALNSPDFLFQYVNTSKLENEVYEALQNLLDNYVPNTYNPASVTDQEKIATFLNVLMRTGPLQELARFLICRGLVADEAELRRSLETVWFYPNLHYFGDGYIGESSGFQYVFVGDYGSTVRGLHNWYKFYKLEQSGKLDYLGYYGYEKAITLGPVFKLSGLVSDRTAAMFVGTSPAFEIALYSFCLYLDECSSGLYLSDAFVFISVLRTEVLPYSMFEYARPDVSQITFYPPQTTTTSTALCGTLDLVSEKMWTADTSRLTFSDLTSLGVTDPQELPDPSVLPDIVLNYQASSGDGNATGNSTGRLFQYVNTDKLNTSATYQKFRHLLQLYKPEPFVDDWGQERQASMMDFVDAILSTGPMQELASYLQCQRGNTSEINWKYQLYKIWFDEIYRYTEAFGVDSSGFERVFVGEFCMDAGLVCGLYNWYRLYLLMDEGQADYQGFWNLAEPNLLSVSYSWFNRQKSGGNVLVGSSPEFQVALYTLCFLERPGSLCPVSLAGRPLTVWTENRRGVLIDAYIRDDTPITTARARTVTPINTTEPERATTLILSVTTSTAKVAVAIETTSAAAATTSTSETSYGFSAESIRMTFSALEEENLPMTNPLPEDATSATTSTTEIVSTPVIDSTTSSSSMSLSLLPPMPWSSSAASTIQMTSSSYMTAPALTTSAFQLPSSSPVSTTSSTASPIQIISSSHMTTPGLTTSAIQMTSSSPMETRSSTASTIQMTSSSYMTTPGPTTLTVEITSSSSSSSMATTSSITSSLTSRSEALDSTEALSENNSQGLTQEESESSPTAEIAVGVTVAVVAAAVIISVITALWCRFQNLRYTRHT